ncbi:sigma-54-dependent transcriptional regulator [Pseudodesulfovibrio tunisiensis]|uniref:sigma-54-dependent transcriptional regulator n=1 Tax=Pseudodesulfovibrio tunisiensis TaxID=463192 RepID=UPI001FB51880|nr:sigma-54 dependent transcriptional regulator [Pseudodesulfovibrio tunisiensis]
MQRHPYPGLPILIVDDERAALDSFEIALYSSGYSNVVVCDDSRKVMDLMEEQEFCLVLLDLIMPHLTGSELLVRIKERFPHVPVIIITAVSDISSVVQCIRNGAVDYILKPVDKEEISNRVRNALEYSDLEQENVRLQQGLLDGTLCHPEEFDHIVTRNSKMMSIFKYCEAVAGSLKPVLITGETGTGKELIAQAVHRLSGRKGEFVAVNIAAFDDAILADSLFGHVRGAFTGADRARMGLVEKANGGTLFLDEIGDLSLQSQVKLLRLLQEQEYFPVGSDVPKKANVRIVTSTLRDVGALKREGKFREDLYYRLTAHHVSLPPLRERPEDVRPLLDHFLRLEAEELGKAVPTYHPELVNLLRTYRFPGNIREFKAMVGDALSRHTSRMLSSASFREHMNTEECLCEPEGETLVGTGLECLRFDPENLPGLKDAVSHVSSVLIEQAMEKSGGNQSAAARILGISQQALSLKLKKMREAA